MPSRFARCLSVAAALAVAPAAFAATAKVEFLKPEAFTDAGRRTGIADRDGNLEALRRHLVEQAARRLPPDQALSVTVTDVDLAGSFEPWQLAHNEVRIVKEIYPPRIDLGFRLVGADGGVVKEGSRTLRDTGFLLGTTRYPSDALRYEKQMLDEWLEREFKR